MLTALGVIGDVGIIDTFARVGCGGFDDTFINNGIALRHESCLEFPDIQEMESQWQCKTKKFLRNDADSCKALSDGPGGATLNPWLSPRPPPVRMQCAAGIRAGELLVLGPVDPMSVGADPFLYTELTYWVLTSADQVPIGTCRAWRREGANLTPAYSGLPADLPITVVSMDAANAAAGNC